MKIERKQLSGVMNLDDSNDVIPGPHHKEARNISFRGGQNGFSAQSALGNRNIANSLPAGTNSCIGAHYDQQKQRLFYFNYNSNGNHGIYIYNTIPKTIQTLFLNNTHSSSDVLGFDINNPITSINIMYGAIYNSTNDTDGDVLYWIDSLGRPSKLNIDRRLAGVYASYKRSYLDVAKSAPSMPIQCTYENDLNVTNNNLKNALYQFIYRWVYDDGEKSVWSTGSEVPLPLFSENQDVSADPKKNSRINLYYSTGDETVRKIEIGVRECVDGVISDYGLVTSIEKSTITGPAFINNIVYNYLFYNNSVITPIDQTERALLFDYVPQKANAQELLNGNTIIYGGITEGYNVHKETNFGNTTNTANGFDKINGLLFFAAQAGVTSYGDSTSIQVILTGAGTNDSMTNVPTTVSAAIGANFVVSLRDDVTGTVYTISYLSSATDNINTILTGLATVATGYGLTTVISGNQLTISEPGISKWLHQAYSNSNNSATPFASTYKTNVLSATPSSSNYKYGVVYYDDKGRTNGVVTTEAVKVNTPRFQSNTNYPWVDITVSGVPPTWASYYHLVRTDNLSYEKNLSWVTRRAFYADASYSSSTERIVYLGIDNMVDYNSIIKSTSGYVSYDFAPGDRIRFLSKIANDGSRYDYNTGSVLDFEVIGTEADPNIDGAIVPGFYIKFKYPTNFIASMFGFFKPNEFVTLPLLKENFQNYHIQIYNNKRPQGTDIYYEFGKQFAIGLPGTSNRYHVGQYQSQKRGTIPGIAQSAGIYVYSGDNYFRYRNVPIGSTNTFSAGSYMQNTGSGNAGQFTTMVINVWDSSNTAKTIDTTEYEIKSQVLPASACGLATALYPNFLTADHMFYNKSATAMTIKVKGTMPVSKIDTKDQYVKIHAKILNSTTGTIQTIKDRTSVDTTNEQYNVEFEGKILVPAYSKVFLLTECDAAASTELVVGSFDLELSIVKNAEIAVIESSFSDTYKLTLNSNSRPVVFDQNAVNAYYPTLIRYGQQNVAGTNMNNSNRFYAANMDEYDRQKGDIVRLKVRGSQMRVFQKRGCGVVGILQNMLFNADGSGNLSQSNQLVNNINYYQGDYGIGGLATSLVSSSNTDYFVDPIRGYQVRLGGDGMTPISALYKAQYYMTSLASRYATLNAGILGGYAKVLGAYDFNEEEYISVFQGFSGVATVTLGFNEYRNNYTTFYDYDPEWITSVEGNIISFKSGQLWIHDTTATYCNYFNTQYKPSLTLVFNDMQTIKKRYNTITMLSNVAWLSESAGDITTNLSQTSILQATDFIRKDDKWHAAFKRDSNSTGGLYNGNVLKGNWAQIKLKPASGNSFVNLFYIELNILEPFYNR